MNFDNPQEFQKYINQLKTDYLWINQEKADDKKNYQLLINNNKNRRKQDTKEQRKLKRDLCRMEAKLMQLRIEGRTTEADHLIKKINDKKKNFFFER